MADLNAVDVKNRPTYATGVEAQMSSVSGHARKSRPKIRKISLEIMIRTALKPAV